MDAIKVFKLDLVSIRPYLTFKNLLLLFGLSIFYCAISKNPVTVLSTIQIFSLLFSGYPFLVGEEAGIDPLYKLFSIDSDDVVKGRYLLAAALIGLTTAAGVMLSFLLNIFFPVENINKIILWFAPSMFFVSSIVIFLEYPIYFKYGYKKGKELASVPMLVIGIIVLCFNIFSSDVNKLIKIFSNNIFAVSLIMFLLWAFTLFATVTASKKIYRQRDF